MANEKADKRRWWVLVGATLLYLARTAEGPNSNAALPTRQGRDRLQIYARVVDEEDLHVTVARSLFTQGDTS